jgi:hypothetical protein
VLLGADRGGARLADAAASVLRTLGAEVLSPESAPGTPAEETFTALVFDASPIASSETQRGSSRRG